MLLYSLSSLLPLAPHPFAQPPLPSLFLLYALFKKYAYTEIQLHFFASKLTKQLRTIFALTVSDSGPNTEKKAKQ